MNGSPVNASTMYCFIISPFQFSLAEGPVMVFSQIAIVFSIRLKAYASGMPLLPFSYGYAYDYNKHYPCYQNILRLKRNSAADYL